MENSSNLCCPVVFNCGTLIEFRLFMLHELRLPSIVRLKNLKILTLAWVDFVFGSDSSVDKLLSCPSLEGLSLINCKWRRFRALHISAPKLLSLNILEHPLYEGLESRLDIRVHGTRIESFAYAGQVIDRYAILSPSSLVVACISCRMSGWPRHHHFRAYHGNKLLKDLSCVKRLNLFNPAKSLTFSCLSAFLFSFYTDGRLFSTFSQSSVTSMNLELGTFADLLVESRFIVAILHKCPHLSHLKFIRAIYVNSETVDAIFDPPPQCFLSLLEVIEIHNFNADYRALSALKVLLRIAGALKKLFIHPPWAQQLPGNSLQLRNALPRASDPCEFLLDV